MSIDEAAKVVKKTKVEPANVRKAEEGKETPEDKDKKEKAVKEKAVTETAPSKDPAKTVSVDPAAAAPDKK